ncbi:helix-turn-helix domain-containing protein [Sulfurospirillum sp. T05]|uniref:Helix-turn-helix domain-containing protein n=1 Tax=Sulfurospirillum tamanense TaxID=2813362 RepID=A0ABS2WNI1_9BACT|nr:helix-turn-helix domain-containing protein [Sulfurospirillum tamanensis]MBN2963168.1 helix-turn-helix domain-containing protein [Sulfurospirillum tamanensis]
MTDKQNKFLALRAEGLTFDVIAKELKTSKPTLIQWSKLFEEEIKSLQFESFLKIKEAYSYSVKAKYEMTLKQLGKIDEAILGADLSSSSIKDLFTIKNSLLSQLEAIEKKISVNAHVTQTDEFGNKETLRLKLNEAE